MPKGISSLEHARDTISRICDFRGIPGQAVFEFSSRAVGGGPYSTRPAQVAGVLSALVVLGYIEDMGRSRNGRIYYRITRQSLRRLKTQVKQADSA